MNELIDAALTRMFRTAVEYITSSVPAGFIVTPVMLQNLDMRYLVFVILAWLITGIIQCGVAFFWGIEAGLPEVQSANETRSADVITTPLINYSDNNYDDLYIDDDVDEGEEDEVEQED